jgi:hypothetical protein
MAAKKSFSRQKLHNHDISEWIWYVWALAPKQMSEKFAEHHVGLNSDADVETLVRYALDGTDASGTLVLNNGTTLMYDTRSILNAVPMTTDQLNGSNLTYY